MKQIKRMAKLLVKCENSYRGFLQYVFWDNKPFSYQYNGSFRYTNITAARFGRHLVSCTRDGRLWALAHNQDCTFDQSKYDELVKFADQIGARLWPTAVQDALTWADNTAKIDHNSPELSYPVLFIRVPRCVAIESTMFAKVFDLKWCANHYSVTLKVCNKFPFTIKSMHGKMGEMAMVTVRNILANQELASKSEIETVEPFSNKYVYLNKPSTESVDHKWSNPVYDAIHAVLDPKFDQLNELMNQRDRLDDQIDLLSKEIESIQKEMENVVYYRKP